MIDLQDTSPLLFDFFAGYFPDAELNGLTDEQVVKQFIDINISFIVKATKKELIQLTADSELLPSIAKEAKKQLEAPDDIWQWIEIIKGAFEKYSK